MGSFIVWLGSSSPLFFTGFLQAKVIKRVIRMLKTDVNNRNETAVTDERLGQERAQLVEMTRLHTPSPTPTSGLSALSGRGLRRPAGDTVVKIALGGEALGGLRSHSQATALLGKEGAARGSPGGPGSPGLSGHRSSSPGPRLRPAAFCFFSQSALGSSYSPDPRKPPSSTTLPSPPTAESNIPHKLPEITGKPPHSSPLSPQ